MTLVDNWNADPGWTKPGHDAARAGQSAAQGYLVVAARKEAGHGHVVVVVLAQWKRPGGVGFKNKGLNFVGKRADLADVQCFAKPVPGLGSRR